MVAYKAQPKSEFIEDAGITRDKLRAWIKEDFDTLHALGLNQQTKILDPAVVKFLCEKHHVVSRRAYII